MDPERDELALAALDFSEPIDAEGEVPAQAEARGLAAGPGFLDAESRLERWLRLVDR